MLDGFFGDLRQAARVLRRSPGFTLVAVFSLALGIGANTAMFGVVQTLVLSPLPVDDPEELAILAWQRAETGGFSQYSSTSYRTDDGVSLRSNFNSDHLRALSAAAPEGVDLFPFHLLREVTVGLGDDSPVLAGGILAGHGYFPTLRVPMALGRGFTSEDDQPGAPTVAVLGHAFWLRFFGGDPEVVGRTVRVNGVQVEIVGVTAAGFKGLSIGGFWPQTDVTLPLGQQTVLVPELASVDPSTDPGIFWLRLMARVPSDLDRDRTASVFATAFSETPSPALEQGEGGIDLRLLDGSRGAQTIGAQTRRLLFLLLGVVASVLLIACVNLASLMLGRGVSRQREMAVRRALGGPRIRLVRQHLTESFVLAATGTTLGVVLAFASQPLLGGLLASSVGGGSYRAADLSVSLDPVVLAVSVLAGLGTTVLFGLLPAVRLGGVDPAGWLKQRSGVGGPRLLLGRILIAGQIAVTLPLVVGATLLLQTLTNLGSIELGFETEGVALFGLDPEFATDPEQVPELYRALLDELEAIPGVEIASLIGHPLLGRLSSNGGVEIGGEMQMMHFNSIGPGYLETLRIPLVAGRMIGLQDGPDSPPVAVVNETAVREIFGGVSPVGQIVRRGGRDVQIVGVIGDTPYRSLREPIPSILHESGLQRPGSNVLLRTTVPLASIEAAIQNAVRRVDPQLPVPEVREQSEILAASTSQERTFTQLMLLFGGFALLLASIGLHGVTAYAVERRTSEIGVRVAVGARPGDILGLVLRQVIVLTGIGLVVGVPLALAGGPMIGAVLYGVAPGEPMLIVLSAVTLLAVSLGAGAIPAMRAARMDALEALRSE